jgi:hypothetical protein
LVEYIKDYCVDENLIGDPIKKFEINRSSIGAETLISMIT